MAREVSHALLVGDPCNLGDAFLALAEARHLHQRGGRVVVLPYGSVADEVRQEFLREGISVLSIRAQPWRALGCVWSSNIYIGGGHALRRGISKGWLTFALVSAFCARLLGRDVRLVCAGVSPVPSRCKKIAVACLMRLCRVISVRDPRSADELASLAPQSVSKIRVTTDVAFVLGNELLSLPTAPRTCVIAPAVDPSEDRHADEGEILEALKALISGGRVDEVVLVAHDTRYDYTGCILLHDVIREQLNLPVRVVCGDGIESGLLSAYRSAGYVISARLHGLIIGALMGRQVYYTKKSAIKLKPFADVFGYISTVDLIEGAVAPVEQKDKMQLMSLKSLKSLVESSLD